MCVRVCVLFSSVYVRGVHARALLKRKRGKRWVGTPIPANTSRKSSIQTSPFKKKKIKKLSYQIMCRGERTYLGKAKGLKILCICKIIF